MSCDSNSIVDISTLLGYFHQIRIIFLLICLCFYAFCLNCLDTCRYKKFVQGCFILNFSSDKSLSLAIITYVICLSKPFASLSTLIHLIFSLIFLTIKALWLIFRVLFVKFFIKHAFCHFHSPFSVKTA